MLFEAAIGSLLPVLEGFGTGMSRTSGAKPPIGPWPLALIDEYIVQCNSRQRHPAHSFKT